MTDRPDLLLFFTDQQRWDTCGCYGQALDVTPRLDALAREGVLFRNSFTCQPVCGPARAALQTGRYPTELGCYTNHRLLPPGTPTIARALRAAGYECGYVGKWHLASTGEAGGPDDFRTVAVPPERRGGWDDFWLAADVLEATSHGWDGFMYDRDGRRRDFPPGRYRVDAQTDWVVEWLERRRRDRPFALMVSYLEPHHQNDHATYEGPHGSRERFAGFTPPGDLAAFPGGEWQREYPDYLGCCRALDDALGRILATLDRLGSRERTLVVFTSDHGNHFRTRNAEYKRSCHDACIRTPLVISGPGFRGGRAVDGPASLIDVPGTLLAAAGVPPLPEMRGRPLQDLVAGRPWREEVFLQISESQVGRALRTPRWTYGVHAPDRDGWRDADATRYVEQHLYDNQADPRQLVNLVADPATAAVRAGLRTRLAARMREVGEPVPEIVPA